MQVIVEIPDGIAERLVPEGVDLARTMLEDRTAQAYREGRLNTAQLREALGFTSRFEVDPFLLEYVIDDYTVDDFHHDMKDLRQVRERQLKPAWSLLPTP